MQNAETQSHNGSLQGWARAGTQPRIAIIGAGMSGIAAVVKLRKAGYTDLTVFEKTDRVGGTWRENTYPGLSCDVPSRYYSFSFALKADWEYRYSYGADIQAYMESVANEFGVTDIVRFNSGVSRLVYDKPAWRLTTSRGEQEIYDVVIAATGVLHNPVFPSIEGLDDFQGASFHSARWDHSVDLSGKKVGVVGTGSTACQIVGAVTPQVGEMYVFQRTPQWMAPLLQKRYSTAWKGTLKALPFLQNLLYFSYYQTMLHTFGRATVGSKYMQKLFSWICMRNLEKNVPDPELRGRLTPDYQATCKRLIFCTDFYRSISRSNAHLVTEHIERIEPEGIRTRDGQLHELDVLVLATGFDPASFVLPTQVTGENGVELGQVWDGAPRAHRAVAMPGFPNFWMLEGPTGPIGNLSLIAISECQVDYVISMLDHMKRVGLAAVAARESAYAAYNDAMNEAVKTTVWATGGCDSWYIDKTGTPNLYPWMPNRYLRDMRRPDFSEYVLDR
jgi:cation diffusion facilitator CzcD-associated flavoprotein CzcO